MSAVGSWKPDSSVAKIDMDFLKKCLQRFTAANTEQIADLLSEQEQSEHAEWMHCERELWTQAAAEFRVQELHQLIRFFTLAEMQFPNWRAGKTSPVIAFARELRRRGEELERELLIWIRAQSDNRYLPYGAALV